MKRRNIVISAVLIAVLVSSLFFTIEHLYLPHSQTAKPEFYVGVQCGYDNVTLCKELIDKTKNYTNLFIIGSTDIARNLTELNDVCDYAYAAGLHFSVFFSPSQIYPELGENLTSATYPNGTTIHVPSYRSNLPMAWIKSSLTKYGNYFLGAYVFDEPGGNQLDGGTQRMVNLNSELDYSSTENAFVQNVSAKIQPYLNSTIMTFTADYGLYWFDYRAGYDAVLADFGFNNSRQLQVALCRGAATAQNKDWGVMLTHRFSDAQLLEPGPMLYDDLVLSYNSGAKYAVVFDFAQTYSYPRVVSQPYEYGILDQEHFDALQNFWNYMQNNPEKYGSLKADVALVLPSALGSGLRSADEPIWGLFDSDQWSKSIWSDVNSYLNEYGSRLSIVYNDDAFTDAVKTSYSQVIYWSAGNASENFPVRNLNTTFGYTTIQAAITSGATSNGQTLSVKPGTYHENIVIYKTLTIIGEDKQTTIIDGGNNGTAVTINQNDVNFSGFTVKNSGSNQNAGICLNNANNTNITNNNVESNYYGIYLNSSSGNTLKNNAMNRNVYSFGIDGNDSSSFSNNIDSSNTINGKKIYYLLNAENEVLSPSSLPDVGYLALINCTNVTVQGLSLTGNYNGLLLAGTQNSTLTDNTVSNCGEGIRLLNSQGNTLRNNHLQGNMYNFWVQNGPNNDVDASNLVNGKPIYYWVNQHDKTVPLDAGYIALVNCSSITIQNLNLSGNIQQILLSSTTDSTITQNRISDSYYGVVLEDGSNHNIINANNVTNCTEGIVLSESSNNNVTGNTLLKNQYGAYFFSSSFNTVTENIVTANTNHGMQFSSGCSNNTLTANQVENNNMGVECTDSPKNSIVLNNFYGNEQSILIHGFSSHTRVAENTIENSTCGIEIAPYTALINEPWTQYMPGLFFASVNDVPINEILVSSSCSIVGNNLTHDQGGILINSANYTNIANNTITGGDYGIALGGTPLQPWNNTLKGNIITNSSTGIYLSNCLNNSILENKITSSQTGIIVESSQGTSLIGNELTANKVLGIKLTYAQSSLLRNNNMTDNLRGFGDDGAQYNIYTSHDFVTGEITTDSQYSTNDVDSSNTVNGKPIYYWVSQADKTVPSDAACIILVNCTNITIHNLKLTSNYDGIQLDYTQNCTITGNTIENNSRGIMLLSSANNTINGNTITNNEDGIRMDQRDITTSLDNGNLIITTFNSTGNTITRNIIANNNNGVNLANSGMSQSSVSGNTFNRNNFVNNTKQVSMPYQNADLQSTATNSWDNGSQGNYWSDYNGTDANHDGVGDSSYLIKAPAFSNSGDPTFVIVGEDHFPLMHPFSSQP